MVDAWREEWGADLPFGFVELAGFQRQDPPELMSKRIVALERMQQQIASNHRIEQFMESVLLMCGIIILQ